MVKNSVYYPAVDDDELVQLSIFSNTTEVVASMVNEVPFSVSALIVKTAEYVPS